MQKTITAFDDNGNTWAKIVTTRTETHGTVLSLGWPVEYCAASTLCNMKKRKKDRFCIDACGMNHRGSSVYVDRAEMQSLLEAAVAAHDQ